MKNKLERWPLSSFVFICLFNYELLQPPLQATLGAHLWTLAHDIHARWIYTYEPKWGHKQINL